MAYSQCNHERSRNKSQVLIGAYFWTLSELCIKQRIKKSTIEIKLIKSMLTGLLLLRQQLVLSRFLTAFLTHTIQ
jgi:hypothetical protein